MRRFILSLAVTLGLLTGGAGLATAAEAVTTSTPVVHVVSQPSTSGPVDTVPGATGTSVVGTSPGVDGTVRPAGVGRWIVEALIKLGRKIYDAAVAAVKAGWAAFKSWFDSLPWLIRQLMPVGAEELFRAIACHVLNQQWAC
ncbi:hypothetical protein GCM10022243_46220 [Saccharothrix violaceirubra]|uniref:Secreted protein n=1 Tax=Saccharothrix violaceirubra TaxID=413306 RepID=A0A7W7WVF9_9PSEU|nr:hypothetical protein [Saccharothrix violaceirubra]MBB4964488.1 hypothetical protein [Saccharothrix violaceirubra]